MERLKLSLENCYGIRKLTHTIELGDNGAAAIYAPNGSMKTSLAKAFQDIADRRESKDQIFPDRPTKRSIEVSDGVELDAESVFVVRGYDTVFGHTEKTSTLLVDGALRLQYEKIDAENSASKERLLKKLKSVSGLKRDIEKEVALAFTSNDKGFLVALRRVREEVEKMKDAPFSSLRYELIFGDKACAFLNKPNVKSAIAEYVRNYNAILSKSTYFKRGVFNYYNATTIAKNLADNGFFDASHTLKLNGGEGVEISDRNQLETMIEQEREEIINDPKLRTSFAAFEKQMSANVDLRDLHDYLIENEDIVPYLENMDDFREQVWLSYLRTCVSEYSELLDKEASSEAQMQEIRAKAAEQSTQWEEVIRIFNDRFCVPFKLRADNRVQVILGQEPMLTLGFSFEEGEGQSVDIDKDNLMRSLSTGELKAFYILNVIFEMEARRKAGQKTLFVVDDIADSFDYKNKYAIIEYLRDMADDPNFYQLILTHNFDFFRTTESRYVDRRQCFMAVKTKDEVKLEKAYALKGIFPTWKQDFYIDPKKKIASIPFIRNIVEYTADQTDPRYMRLTSMLHVRDDTSAMTVGHLDSIFAETFSLNGASSDPNQTILALIRETADECLKAGDGINFENKIVLSIAIRLVSEQFMSTKINDPDATRNFASNQTSALYRLFRRHFPDERAANDVLRQVMLMTPESIHLNSFMYEPILDMSDEHLKRLYKKVVALS